MAKAKASRMAQRYVEAYNTEWHREKFRVPTTWEPIQKVSRHTIELIRGGREAELVAAGVKISCDGFSGTVGIDYEAAAILRVELIDKEGNKLYDLAAGRIRNGETASIIFLDKPLGINIS